MDQIEDNDKLAEEQAVLDNQEDKVEDMTERPEDLVKTTEPVMPHASDIHAGDHRLVVRLITERNILAGD